MKENTQSRRAFLGASLSLLGATSFSLTPGDAQGATYYGLSKALTVQDVMNLVIRNVSGAPFANTVDTLKAGKADQEVTGIVTTMFCTVDVIRKAAAVGANFVIAHEPTFYNHFDKTDFLEGDVFYQAKRDLLTKHSMAVWRCHDYIHSFVPDGVETGVANQLGWDTYVTKENPSLFQLPQTPLKNIAEHLKSKLGPAHVRVIGQLNQPYGRVLLMPGAAGGQAQIGMTQKYLPEVLVCGELSEWETAEYFRDSIASGGKRALIVLGHVLSEEPGMKWLAGWLSPQVQGIKVTHVPSADPFTWV